MNFKLVLLICFITVFIFFDTSFSLFAASNVTLAWNPSISTNVAGYKIYYGLASGVYNNTISVGNTTNATVTGLVEGTTYYFAATAFDALGTESQFSNETSYSVPTNSTPINIIYVGVQVDYGVSLTSINSQRVLVMSVTNHPGYFYNESLIITNRPFVGTKPVDTNRYVYLGTLVQYGSSIITLNSSTFPLITFTNPPVYYYRSSLILTNHPF